VDALADGHHYDEFKATEPTPGPANGAGFQELENQDGEAHAALLDAGAALQAAEGQSDQADVDVIQTEIKSLKSQITADDAYLASFDQSHASVIAEMKIQNMDGLSKEETDHLLSHFKPKIEQAQSPQEVKEVEEAFLAWLKEHRAAQH
jgi:hypothetical protein